MGVGAPEDVVECVARGIDIFDCAMPTRVARNGALYTPIGRVDIENAAYSQQEGPIDPTCHCYTCQNLAFMSNLVQNVRNSILNGAFSTFREKFLSTYQTTNEQTRISQKQKWLEARENKTLDEA